ncbi:GNAT family N-acetyltransferase [Guptibacillus hwajinpoensis]|uniref:RimJ/RimL family protein N-acetyltransferase n=1 Tax=Guptibacillus hwajinpoensis TaxID=208199 RepID=A0ABU0K3N5_9BACL|nr:GNAT family N-acetyltransferase [Alkalihalobacillus hemicentroti]MDQ0483976.1 RimJ/RimL family protein N-acetyltransferase [Alkalihalobacillus hemicentroti]
MTIDFIQLTKPTSLFVEVMSRWENDESLIPLIRPNQNREELEKRQTITLEGIKERLEYLQIYQIFMNNKLIGEMNYMVDPPHLFKKENGTAWIGITIGEPEARGKGVGSQALGFLEKEIKNQGFHRIELGVFEFNTKAHELYQKLGYKEIARLEDFTYWQGRMWSDIRMEKYI